MPADERTTEIQGETLTFRLSRSAEATQVRIDAGLEGIRVVVPEGQDVDPEAVLAEKASWVLKQRDRYARYRAQMPERRFEEGEAFPLLGEEREIVVGNVLFSHVSGEAIHLDQEMVEEASIKEELERVYREEARRHFTERAEHFAEVLGVQYEQIQIRNQKTRWGSYSTKTGTLSLNFRLLMASPDIVDYVIVHELAHAEHPNHGPRFWRLVEQHVPDYEKKNEWLEENGTRLIFDGSAA
jgi:Predicted metal-dependent hydrolase